MADLDPTPPNEAEVSLEQKIQNHLLNIYKFLLSPTSLESLPDFERSILIRVMDVYDLGVDERSAALDTFDSRDNTGLNPFQSITRDLNAFRLRIANGFTPEADTIILRNFGDPDRCDFCAIDFFEKLKAAYLIKARNGRKDDIKKVLDSIYLKPN